MDVNQPDHDLTTQLLALLAQQNAAVTALQAKIDQLTTQAPAQPTSRGAGDRITVAQLTVKAIAALPTTTRRTYAGYMRLLAVGDPTLVDDSGTPWQGLGDMWVDEVLASDLEGALQVVYHRHARSAQVRAERREAVGRVVRTPDGSHAGFNAVGAWRAMFEVAIADRHLAEGMNPAMKITKPQRKNKGSRMALETDHLQATLDLMGSTGDDPELDGLLGRYLLITGARQEGALNLHVGDVDPEECTVLLDEKFGSRTYQPVPDWFAAELLEFARSRGSVRRTDKTFVKCSASGAMRAIGRRRFNYIFGDRLQSSYEWADRLQVTAHTLRHTAITVVERHAGQAVAQAFARHAPETTSDIYAAASRQEVARAVVDLYGGDHPWLHRQPRLAR